MKKDRVYLTHILDAISDIEKFMQGVPEKEFLRTKRNSTLSYRVLEIIVRQPRI